MSTESQQKRKSWRKKSSENKNVRVFRDFEECAGLAVNKKMYLYVIEFFIVYISYSFRCNLFAFSGFTITVGLNESQLSITVAAPDDYLNETKGLLGVFNKDPSDDLTPADGSTPLNISASEKTIFFKFGETCKLP